MATLPPTPLPTAPPSARCPRGLRAATALALLARWPFALAFAVPFGVFWLARDVGFGFLDEGFVWYGAQRVLQGEVPLRDFQSYDMARYYWYAGWMWLSGSSGLLPMRLGSAVLAGAAVAIAMRLVTASSPAGTGARSAVAKVLAVLTFSVWMVPYYKVADSFAALLLLAGVAGLTAGATPGRWLRYGICLGVAASIGINHALYGVVAGVLVLAWGWWRGVPVLNGRGLGCAAAGAAMGYAPVIALHLGSAGFTAAFVDSIRILFEMGTTNLGGSLHGLLVSWDSPKLSLLGALREAALSTTLLLLAPVFGLFCAWQLLRRGRGAAARCSPVFIAATITAVSYAHYAVSRPDIAHLAVSVLPLLVAAWTLPWRVPEPEPTAAAATAAAELPAVLQPRQRALRRARAWPTLPGSRTRQASVRLLPLAAVAALSALLATPAHLLCQRLRGAPLEAVGVGDEVLRVSPTTAAELRFLQRLRAAYGAPMQALYVVPYWPGAYAALRMRSPAWEIYAIFPATAVRQQRELARLLRAGTAVAVVQQSHMDERPDLGFNQTHPLVARYLANCMTRLSAAQAGTPPALDVVVYAAGGNRCPPP